MLYRNVCIWLILLPPLADIFAVQRVHWLRARAQKERWAEEKILVGYEMQWTVRYFLHYRDAWRERTRTGIGIALAGSRAYGARKEAMWEHLAQQAEVAFKTTNMSYVSVYHD